MSTTLLAAQVALSKELGDYWASTTTSNGAAGKTTLVDTALMAKANDWVTDEAYDQITSGSADEEERKVSSLDNSDGTLTMLAHSAQIVSGVTYQVHRLFSGSEKRTALIKAAQEMVYPSLFTEVWDETLVIGNWFTDGSFELWDDANTLTNWTDTTLTVTQTSTVPYRQHGTYSAKLDTAAGTLVQSISNFEDLQYLRGRNVTFTLQVWCDTASALRISVNDGTTQTYSSYHDGDSAWTQDDPRNDSLYVMQYIDPNATEVTFTIHLESAAATAYVDDARAISNYRSRLYIGNLGLSQNRPNAIEIEPRYYSQQEPWIPIRDWELDDNGYLYIPARYETDRRIRIKGKKYIAFVDSNGASSTDWDSTIDIDSPQLSILVADAALYLYQTMSLPNYETGTRKEFQEASNYWAQQSAMRKAKFGMYSRAGATVHYGR